MLLSIHMYWYVLPLVLVISLVYSATRHEALGKILHQAVRLFGVILGVLAITTVILLVINSQT